MALVLVFAACGGDQSPTDGERPPGGGGHGGRERCQIGENRDAESALELELGEAARGFVCPRRDSDWFWFEVPEGHPLVLVELGFSEGAISPVELAYDIFREGELSKPVASAADEDTSDHRSVLRRRHYLGSQGGTYLIRVYDAGEDDEDTRNAWTLRISAAEDPDGNEPNESCSRATPLEGIGKGAISFEGDRDAYSFMVVSSQIVEVRVSSPRSPVALKVSLYDADGEFLFSRSDPLRGGPNEITLRRGVQRGGTACVIVEDIDGTAADPRTMYSIETIVVNEDDPNDQGTRNDTPATATPLGRGGDSVGSIFSPGDHDWFKIDAREGEILDLEVSCDDCDFDLAVNLVYGHQDSPCSSSDSCDYLLTPTSCGRGGSCGSGVCRETPAGARCALACSNDLACPSFQCQQAGGVNACVGSAVCVPEEEEGGSCGVIQYGTIANAATSQLIHFAQPILRGPVYVLVHAYRDDSWSDGRYEIKASLREDPDDNERGGKLNNFYLPYTDVTTLPAALRRARDLDLPTPAPWEDVMEWHQVVNEEGEPVFDEETDEPVMEEVLVAKETSGRGCIGFSADVDVFRLGGGNPCGKGNCGMVLETSRPAGGDLNLAWFILNQSMSPVSSFLESERGGDPIFGDAACVEEKAVECNTYNHRDSGDYYLVVYDRGLSSWDPHGDHCYTWKMIGAVEAGCPESCPNEHPRSGLCTCESP